MTPREPFAVRLHGFARLIRRPQAALVSFLRRDLERAPHWVLLTTRGRKTGLPREVLLPCSRDAERVLVISTYARRSAWIRNLEACADVKVTADGVTRDATAEIVDDLARKRRLVEEMPFIPLAPSLWLQA
ncbi:MAG: nitroreductase family deazaflavin-dependent oxidoreductase, partial [Myxococcota bacterium]